MRDSARHVRSGFSHRRRKLWRYDAYGHCRQIYANRQLLEKWEGATKARLFGAGAKLGLYLYVAVDGVRGRKAEAEATRCVLCLLREMSERGSSPQSRS